MERTVYALAILGAVMAGIIFVLSHTFHEEFASGHIRFGNHIGLEQVYEVAAENGTEQTYAAHSIGFDYVAARIVVTPEARDDIAITIENPGRLPTPAVSAAGGRIEIDGRLRGRVDDCRDSAVHVRGYGQIANDELPLIQVRTPMSVDIEVVGASITRIGASDAVAFANHGCGHADIANVAGPLELQFAGSGTVVAANAGRLTLELPGSGDVTVGDVAERADIAVYGSGNVRLTSLTGDLSSEIGGSGSISIQRGHISQADVSIGGSGQFELNEGDIDAVRIEIGGAGDVRLPGPVRSLEVELGGAGNVNVAGDVVDLRAEIAGVGHVRVGAVTGRLEQEVIGFGGVTVGR